jgi:hypothetical protein
MAKYLVRPGYCLHLPHGCFAHPGEEVELSEDLEKKVLEGQGWKVMPMAKPAKEPKQPEPQDLEDSEPKEPEKPEDKEVAGPPRDRAVKGAATR